MRKNLIPLAFAFCLLAGCAGMQSAKNDDKLRTPGGVMDVTHPPSDACHASQFRYLVGKTRSEMPPKPDGANWRVACTSCAVTLEYSPTRMNIFFDEKTDVIKEVKCG